MVSLSFLGSLSESSKPDLESNMSNLRDIEAR